jgi:hypothetical protein
MAGSILLLLSISIFLYYTIWALITVRNTTDSTIHSVICSHPADMTSFHMYCSDCSDHISSHFISSGFVYFFLFQPFLPRDHFLVSYFPSLDWAWKIPAGLLVTGVTVIGLFFASVLRKQGQKKKAQ